MKIKNIEKYKVQHLGKIGKINIWLVDGTKIRSGLEEEFNNFGQNCRFDFIPKNEFWIDNEADKDERHFFFDHLLTERRLMDQGRSCAYAREKAGEKEVAERKKTLGIKTGKKPDGSLKKRIYLKLLKRAPNDLAIWLVDGSLVRSLFYVDFTEGGHDLVYDFVPKKEVWIDNDIFPKERKFVLLHEVYERYLMSQGFSYGDAHKKASGLEWKIRHNPVKLGECLAFFLSSK